MTTVNPNPTWAALAARARALSAEAESLARDCCAKAGSPGRGERLADVPMLARQLDVGALALRRELATWAAMEPRDPDELTNCGGDCPCKRAGELQAEVA